MKAQPDLSRTAPTIGAGVVRSATTGHADSPPATRVSAATGQPDWSRVRRAVYEVQHHYSYTYTGPVRALRQRLVMIPPDHHVDQRLLSHSLDVRGAGAPVTLAWETDPFGNRVCWV